MTDFKQVNKIWMPAYDKMFPFFAKLGHYQDHIYHAAMKFVTIRYAAIDVGANIGFYSREMAKRFQIVYAFEPIPENYECLIRNVPDNVQPIRVALGAEKGKVKLSNLGSKLCGGYGRYDVPDAEEYYQTTLDSYDLMGPIGLIKIDVQGMETDVLLGAEQTIRAHRPVVIVEVEQWKKVDPRPVKLLTKWGATLVKSINADRILFWKNWKIRKKATAKPRIYPR